MSDLLVLGLGNVLLTDDGAGPAAIALLLERYQPPAAARVLDGGTLGLSLLPHIEDAGAVILVDAVKADCPPGTMVRLSGERVGPAVATRLSPHQVGVADLLEAARWHDRYPPTLILLGVVPEAFDLSVGLSPSVAAALPALVELIAVEAAALGFAFERIASEQQRAMPPPADLGRLALGAP